jgi:hypothetical protein
MKEKDICKIVKEEILAAVGENKTSLLKEGLDPQDIRTLTMVIEHLQSAMTNAESEKDQNSYAYAYGRLYGAANSTLRYLKQLLPKQQ